MSSETLSEYIEGVGSEIWISREKIVEKVFDMIGSGFSVIDDEFIAGIRKSNSDGLINK